jgi:hypothetical protein
LEQAVVIFRLTAGSVNREERVRERAAMLTAAFGAGLGFAALILQLVLTLAAMRAQGGTALEGLWRFAGFFTIVANAFAAAMLGLAVLRRSTARLEFSAMTSMILVSVVYSLLLRDTWIPQGWQKVADVALHDAMPLIVVLFWLLRPHRRVGKSDILAAIILPLGYCAYAMMRGAFDHWYAYAFLDVARFGAGQVAINCAGLGAAFTVMTAALAGLDRALR